MTVEEMRAEAAKLRKAKEALLYPTLRDDFLVTQLEFIAELCARLENL